MKGDSADMSTGEEKSSTEKEMLEFGRQNSIEGQYLDKHNTLDHQITRLREMVARDEFRRRRNKLIRNPEKMKKARLEVDKLMQNNNNGSIQESNISQLTYLQAVIKETMRLHPPAPFLIPRQAMHDVAIHGFVVPKNAQILCNVWAMGRDPNIWSDPEMFMPERFLDVKIDYKGQNFELIPFGAGRRMCPGLNLANRMLHIILASLIHKFDWKVVGNTRPEDIDMEEKYGITLQKAEPLMVIPMKL
ncbi:cytochrome P450 76T24-like [Lactuca sativa]|uniref:cytochrome P450 76T24-like n=1 Tax=Lactuca sativa TaxID=4236 RepID=UPI0022AEA9EC|nr:cytochrome P450 76T24-like [Lactuca sativa]